MHRPLLILALLLVSGTATAQTGQTLGPSDAGDRKSFGWSSDILLNWAVIGAPGDQSGAGAVYVYQWDGSDAPFVEYDKLTPSDGALNGSFGYSVAISGRAIAVGAPANTEVGYKGGAVYMFRLDTNGWVEEQKILPPSFGSEFGYSVDVYDDLLVVGARLDSENGLRAGAAHLYRYRDGAWMPEMKLMASDPNDYAGLGERVAAGLDRVVAGAPGSSAQGDNAGAAYVFYLQSKLAGVWVEEARLLASDGQPGEYFGSAVDMDGDRVVVGGWNGTGLEARTGAAYIYERSSSVWTESEKIWASDGGASEYFGYSVALSGDVLAVGAPYRYVGEHWAAGAVYLFEKDGSGWSSETLVTSPAPDWQEFFGFSVSAWGNELLIGARGNREAGGFTGEGMAYVYKDGLLAVDVEDPAVAGDFRLDQNYPNPFNPVTSIRYTLPAAGDVSLVVYDMLGNEVSTLVSGVRPAGAHDVTFDAAGLPSGVYMYRVRTATEARSRSMVVLK